MNSLLASNINGGFNKQQVANGSSTSVLSSFIDFTVTETMTNYSSSQQGKSLIKLTTDTEDILYNGQQGKSVIKMKDSEDILCNGQQGKSLIKLKDTEDILCNGQNKVKIYDQNKNTLGNYVTVNGNNKDKSSEDTIPVPKLQLFTGKIHPEWNQAYKIGAGLSNLGNTCFMNTVIQCLTYCPPLANYLLNESDHASKCQINNGFCMMCILQRHMKKAIGKTGEVIKPFEIFQRLKTIAKHFQYNRQEDAHEFLRYVVDHLWKSCLTQVINGTKLDSASKETTVINKIFGGYHRSQVICLRCKKKSNTYDHFMDFMLDVKPNVMSLEKALEKYIQPELLQQENSYKCPKCKMKVDAQKRFSVFQPPLVATFQLKRFDYNRSFGGKITKQILYPEKLNLRPYMSETQGEPVMYNLNAVLVHSGPSCNSGHYYCYVKNSNGCWYIMDDSRVQQTNLNNVLNQMAYVLFYIRRENSERAPLKKCLDIKNTYMKGATPNSHYSKVNEVNNVMKPIALSDSNSSFCNSKTYNSPNGVKKFNNFSSPNREKISFGFRPSATSTQLSSPKSKSESVKQSGLVPYMEDSSESSDASDSCSAQNNKSNSITNNVKHLLKTSTVESYKLSPTLEIKTKYSKSVSKSYSPVNNTPHKVSATDSWIVTDAPQTAISSSSSGVNSTTDWNVIEASDLALNSSSCLKENKNSLKESLGSLKESKNNSVKGYLSPTKESKNNGIKESSGSSKIFTPVMLPPEHSENTNAGSHDLSSSAKMSNNYESNPSAENCDFRKQTPKSKVFFPEEEEASSSFKRKYCDSNSKVFKDSPHSDHNESRYSPLPKKIKYAENSSYLNLESDVRNSESKIKNINNCCASSTVQQRQYASNCDNSRTYLANGVSHFSDFSPNKNSYSSPMKSTLNNPENDRLVSKGNQDLSSEYCNNNYPHEKDKLPISDRGNNGFLFGTEVPTWGEGNHYRPSLNSGHEVRRTFDGYDNDLDRGKVRKSKNNKDRYHYFHQKNSFQKHADNRYQGKFNRRYYNNHQNFRKYDSRHNWKPNHRNNYQRYHNQHHRY